MKITLLACSVLLCLGCKKDQEKVASIELPATVTRPATAPGTGPAGTNYAATGSAAGASDPAPIAVGTKMKCPVTGEDFTVREKTVQVAYQGKRYAFCCADCLPEFNKNPAKFAAK